MSKIWVLSTKFHKRTFKTEKSFLDFISIVRKNRIRTIYEVEIYERVEHHTNSNDYLDSFLTQKERDEQLSVLLENNHEIQSIQSINLMIEQYILVTDKPNKNFRKYLNSISLVSLNFSSFKKIISDYDIRRAFLYDGPSSVEWYKAILSIHNFKFEKEIQVGRNKVPVSKERIDNFIEAKNQLKTKK